MQNVLLVFSPFDIHPLAGQAAVDLALELKSQGAGRVDITVNRHYNAAAHGRFAIGSFERAAQNLRELMNQVVGMSEIYDLPTAMQHNRARQAPQIADLARHCFWQVNGTYSRINSHDERDMNIILYAALLAIQYDRVAFTDLSKNTIDALYAVGHNIRGLKTKTHGRPVLLDAARGKIADWNRERLPLPTQTYN